MPKISHQCLCDHSESPDRFYRLAAKGGAVACAAAYPTKESFGASACERAVTVSTESFLRRPSMRDEAPQAISGFVNEAVYALQEPRKTFFCHTAMLYILNGQFRCVLSGDAKLLHFNGGNLLNTFEAGSNPLFGKSLKAHFTASDVSDLPRGANAFLLCSGCEDPEFDIAALGQAMQTADPEQRLNSISGTENLSGTLLAVVIPERKSLFGGIFGAK